MTPIFVQFYTWLGNLLDPVNNPHITKANNSLIGLVFVHIGTVGLFIIGKDIVNEVHLIPEG